MNNTALGAVSNKKENIRFISEAHENGPKSRFSTS